MSTPNAVVVKDVETIFDKILPFLPNLVSKVPAKIRAYAYVGIPVVLGVFDLLAPQIHVGSTAVVITDFVGLAATGLLASGNTNVKA